jgi:tRNA 2-thiocytidine biosynthesis protein TtcA
MTEHWLYKTSHLLFKKVIEKDNLLEDGEKVLIGVSGGVDSMVLTHLFNSYNMRRYKNWNLLAVHINPGFPNWNTQNIIRFFEDVNIPYLIASTNIPKKLAQIKTAGRINSCFFCSRERRKRLFEIADKKGIKKIALAHHLEDVNETFFLNLMFTSKTATFVPKQDFFQQQFYIIRPLYNFDKELVLRYAKTYGIPTIKNRCPYEKESERNHIRGFLTRIYKKNSRIKTNIFSGINNIKVNFLP